MSFQEKPFPFTQRNNQNNKKWYKRMFMMGLAYSTPSMIAIGAGMVQHVVSSCVTKIVVTHDQSTLIRNTLKWMVQHREWITSFGAWDVRIPQAKESSQDKVELVSSPGLGYHVVRIPGMGILVVEVNMTSEDVPIRSRWQRRQLILYFPPAPFGCPSEEFVREMLSHTQLQAIDKVPIYTTYSPVYQEWAWEWSLSKPKRAMSSVILREGLADEIIEKVKGFFGSAASDATKGIPHRRGLMFEGPPGGGKSSFILALASVLNMGISMVSLSGNISDEGFRMLLCSSDPNNLIVMEDFDRLFPVQFEGATKEEQFLFHANSIDIKLGMAKPINPHCSVTVSGVLNALDGIASQEGRVIIYTTNHPENIDDAIMRPGRVDFRFKFDMATKDQALKLFLKFHPKRDSIREEIEQVFQDGLVSMAKLQGIYNVTEETDVSQIVPRLQEAMKIARLSQEIEIQQREDRLKAARELLSSAMSRTRPHSAL